MCVIFELFTNIFFYGRGFFPVYRKAPPGRPIGLRKLKMYSSDNSS